MAFLRGVGYYVPERVVDNVEMAALTGATPEWILSVSGIEERRFAADESVGDIAAAAAQDCLNRSGVPASDVGMLIVASGTAERRFPGPAALVAHRLGLSGPPVLDLPVPSAGAIIAL